MLVPLLLVVLAGLLQALLLWAIRTVWPTRDPVFDAQREADLRRRFGAASDKVSDLVTLAALAGALAGPFLGYQLARALALARSPERDDLVLFFGFGPMAIPFILAGYLAVVALGPAFIRWRYRGERRDALLWLYSLGERKEGAAGRWAVRNAGQLALAGTLIPLLLWGNRYTLVGARRIEVPSPTTAWSRLAIATKNVTHLSIGRRSGGSRDVCVRFANGMLLDSTSEDGRFDGYGRGPVNAILLLSRHTGVSVAEVDLLDAESPCAAAVWNRARAQAGSGAEVAPTSPAGSDRRP